MTKPQSPFTGSLASVGKRQSVLAPGFVGFMRRLGLTSALTAGAGIAALGYAHWEAQQPVLRHYRVTVPPRPGFTGITLLHVSDLHMFPGQDFIADFIRRVAEEEQFDLVISTGDNLGDAHSSELLLQAFDPLLGHPGAFVLGSNDYYSPAAKSWLRYLGRKYDDRHVRNDRPDLPWLDVVRRLTDAGWLDLSNRADTLTISGAEVVLVGVDDPHIRRDRLPSMPQQWNDTGALRLGLTHAPYRRILDPWAEAGTDLILAGHTHGGQVRVPGVGALVTNCDLPRRYASGLHQWFPQRRSPSSSALHPTYLHVSAGLGTSQFAQIRFACRPEASLIEVVPSAT